MGEKVTEAVNTKPHRPANAKLGTRTVKSGQTLNVYGDAIIIEG